MIINIFKNKINKILYSYINIYIYIYMNEDSNKRVGYFYNSIIGKFKYGKNHPMKPKRVSMTHNLILSYDLY